MTQNRDFQVVTEIAQGEKIRSTEINSEVTIRVVEATLCSPEGQPVHASQTGVPGPRGHSPQPREDACDIYCVLAVSGLGPIPAASLLPYLSGLWTLAQSPCWV